MDFKLKAIYTPYNHISKLSGHTRVLEHIQTAGILMSHASIPQGMDTFFIKNRLARKIFQKTISYKGVLAYSLNDFMLEWELWRKRKQRDFQILHFFDAEHCPAFLPGLYHRKPATERPLMLANVHVPASKMESYLNFNVLNQLDHIITYASDQKEILESHLQGPSISMIPHGIDTKQFKPLPEKQKKNRGKFRLLTLGRMMRDYKCVWQVARQLEHRNDIEFEVISREIPPEGLSNVRMRQNLSDDDLRQAYLKADALFLPLQAAAANNSLLEAAACGLPIITSDLPAIRDYFPDNASIRIPNNNIGLFVKSIEYMEKDPHYRKEIGKAARKIALRYDWEIISEQHIALYNKLLIQSK